MLEKVEQGQSKSPANFVQIYFPHSAGIPGGFRAVGEQGIGFPLTYNLVKQRELESKKMPGRPSIEENPEIEIEERGFLETYPLVYHCLSVLLKRIQSSYPWFLAIAIT